MAVLTPARKERLHRRSLRLKCFTVAWNVIEAVAAAGIGLVVGTVALIGLGVDSGIEGISAVALLYRLYHPKSGTRRSWKSRALRQPARVALLRPLRRWDEPKLAHPL